MNFSSNGHEESSGFNQSGVLTLKDREIETEDKKTKSYAEIELEGITFDKAIEREITNKLTFKGWTGLPQAQDNGCNQLILIMQ